MAHNLTPSGSYTADVPVPDPGDARTAASVIQFAQPLTDRVDYLRTRAFGAKDGSFIVLPIVQMRVGPEGGNWTWIGGPASGTPFWWNQSDVSAATSLTLELGGGLVPAGITITQVRAIVIGSTGAAHAGLPATKPKLYFEEYDVPNGISAGQVTYTVNVTDPSGTQAAYDAQHNVDLTVSRLLNAQKRYAIVFRGETGANAAANKLALTSLEISWTAP